MNSIPLHQYHWENSTGTTPLEFLSLERLPAGALVPKPNRHDFHEIFWVASGRGKHFIDFCEYEIRPNALFFVKQGNVHYWKIEEPLQGYALLFPPDLLLSQQSLDFASWLDLLRAISATPAIYPTAVEAPWFREAWQRIDHEHNRNRLARTRAIFALLQLLLIEAARIALTEPEAPLTPSASVKLAYQYQ